MSKDPYFNIDYLDPNASSPEVVVNAHLDAMIARFAKTVLCGFGNTNLLTLTQDQQAAGGKFLLDTLSPGPSAAVTLTFNAHALGMIVIENQCGFSATLKVSGQLGTLPTLAYKAIGIFWHDGATLVKIV